MKQAWTITETITVHFHGYESAQDALAEYVSKRITYGATMRHQSRIELLVTPYHEVDDSPDS